MVVALTKENREGWIAHAKKVSDYGAQPFPLMTKQLMEIALASPTAVPFGWGNSRYIFRTLEETLKPGYIGTSVPTYDEPPVPEIKFPETIPHMGQNSEYDT